MPSTVIAGFNYDPGSRVLSVTFISGIVYKYLNVPEEIYRALRSSFSKGTFLNQKIKGKYPFERVIPQTGGAQG
jgi:hypothetical protein